jgi:DNA-binding transcriptional MerR regulator
MARDDRDDELRPGREDDLATRTDGGIDRDLIPIGQVARLAGISVGALRHYDELDLLRPADVDRFTGYRRYRRDQVETAQVIRRLRDLELPIEDIRAVLASDDPDEQRRLLASHRARVEARANRLHLVMHHLNQLSTGKDRLVPAQPTTNPGDLDPAAHRRLGVDLFNYTWTLIEKADRTDAETDEMIHAAHASRWHWARAEGSGVQNLGRGEWQCSRVYATIGRGEPALWHARRCVEYSEAAAAAGVAESWDVPASYEAMARALAVSGDRAAAEEWRARARAAVAAVDGPEDRQIIEQDLATLPL